ncbi:hypothetical protein KNV66_gp41 [Bacillus phage DLc1]|uniref:Uncharacterized protein n=1 Tax=Bacillus phage DLc1 TaxID=2777318 RepID=A0A7M1RR63_9CAUD|nr:hypothetical protein KNV66_gp41 [Bacillus phage DLc1]QOR56262.1 hypothetical protein [Bacillus phage DLc1]
MKRQVRAMLKEHNRLGKLVRSRHLSLNKPNLQFRLFCEYMMIKSELKKWGYNKCGL